MLKLIEDTIKTMKHILLQDALKRYLYHTWKQIDILCIVDIEGLIQHIVNSDDALCGNIVLQCKLLYTVLNRWIRDNIIRISIVSSPLSFFLACSLRLHITHDKDKIQLFLVFAKDYYYLQQASSTMNSTSLCIRKFPKVGKVSILRRKFLLHFFFLSSFENVCLV